jgi:hypothetical protein
MDAAWFKKRQKTLGVTSFDLGAAIHRDRSVISKIINGAQKMTLDQARTFAEALQVPLAEMVERGGLGDAPTAQQLAPGFSESDVAPWVPGPVLGEANSVTSIAAILGADRPGVDIWRVKSRAMALAGYMEGDFMLVDTHTSERARPGDTVIAQIYSRNDATTVLRRFSPPVLVAASADPEDAQVFVVDGMNVVIRGKVVASWRM